MRRAGPKVPPEMFWKGGEPRWFVVAKTPSVVHRVRGWSVYGWWSPCGRLVARDHRELRVDGTGALPRCQRCQW